MSRLKALAALIMVGIVGYGVWHLQFATSERPGTGTPAPGSPDDVYYQVVYGLIHEDPTAWGGSYADGDTLVVKYTNQSKTEAEADLRDAGAHGKLRLEHTEVSIADLRQAQNDIIALANRYPTIVSADSVYNVGDPRVEVRITDNDPAAIEAVTAIGTKFDAPVRIRTSSQIPDTG